MREYIEQYRVPVPKIRFGGLDTKHSELFTKEHMSSDMRNVDLRPVGGLRKRDGLVEYNSLLGSGDVHTLHPLTTATATFLYAVRGTTIQGTENVANPWLVLVDVPLTTGGHGRCETAYFVDEDDADDSSGWTDHRACSYIVTGEDEPVILFGDLTPGSQGITWPLGVYDADPAVAKRGYPARWADADGPGTPDWPSGLSYTGANQLSESTIHPDTFARMFAYGFTLDPDRIDYSQLGVPYNMLHANVTDESASAAQDGGFFYCMRGDGDRVVGVRKLGDATVVFKRHKTCIYLGEVGSGLGLSSILPVGAVSDDSIVYAGNDIFFWSDDGPRSLSGVIKFGDINEFDISGDIFESVSEVAVDSLPITSGRFEREYNRVIWHTGTAGDPDPDICFVYYLPDADSPEGRWSLWDGLYSELTAICQVTPGSAPAMISYGLDATGRFFIMNSGVTDANEAIDAYYVTKWFDLDTLSIDKRLMALTVVYGDEGRGDAVIEYATNYADGFSLVGHVIQSYGGSGDAVGLWDGGELWGDDDPVEGGDPLWDVTSRGMSKYGLTGLGFIVRFKISDASEGGFSIPGMALDVSFKGKV